MKEFCDVWPKKTVVFTTMKSKRLTSFRPSEQTFLRIESLNLLDLAVSCIKATAWFKLLGL